MALSLVLTQSPGVRCRSKQQPYESESHVSVFYSKPCKSSWSRTSESDFQADARSLPLCCVYDPSPLLQQKNKVPEEEKTDWFNSTKVLKREVVVNLMQTVGHRTNACVSRKFHMSPPLTIRSVKNNCGRVNATPTCLTARCNLHSLSLPSPLNSLCGTVVLVDAITAIRNVEIERGSGPNHYFY